MATPIDFSEEGDAEIVLEEKIGELRSDKKALLECLRPLNDVLERTARREREYVDIQHRLIAEKHDRQKQKQTVERLIEVEAGLKHVKSENVNLKRSLDKAAKR